MNNSPICVKGRGYADDTTFDKYLVIAEPLPTRESRIFRDPKGGGCDYSSHSVKLAVHADPIFTGKPGQRQLYILLEHGGGRRVIAIDRAYHDDGEFEAAVLALPERVQYSTLRIMAEMVECADRHARMETRSEWAQAFCDGRIRKSRVRQGRRDVTIEPKVAAPEYDG